MGHLTRNRTDFVGTALEAAGVEDRLRRLLMAAALSALVAGCGGSDHAKPAGPAATAGAVGSAPPAHVVMTGSSSKTSLQVVDVDEQLASVLKQHGFTGAVEQTLETRLGRKIDPRLAEVGQQLFFDRLVGLRSDNSCAGCHSPTNGFGDTQSISVGIQNNQLVGPHRFGARNQRRAPSVVNASFYPNLMWNGRFASASGDPFDNSQGFIFPPPEGSTTFRPNDPRVRQLLVAHAHMPPTELNEAAGFRAVRNGVDPRLWIFDDGVGTPVPDVDANGFRNDAIRAALMDRINATPDYVAKFGEIFPEVKAGLPVDIVMFAQALAEFENTLVRADAPIDRFARGDKGALSGGEKRGALLFFGKANCVACHAVSGQSNEMFSDFRMHNIGVPQIAPEFGLGKGDTIFDGPGEDEDYGLAQVTGRVEDRYKFRTSPLRNVALQPAFFHNGAFTDLDDAVRHHLDVLASLRNYDARKAGVARDLTHRMAPIANVSASLDPLVSEPTRLTDAEVKDLVDFVKDGLLDKEAKRDKLCRLIPRRPPGKAKGLVFEGC